MINTGMLYLGSEVPVRSTEAPMGPFSSHGRGWLCSVLSLFMLNHKILQVFETEKSQTTALKAQTVNRRFTVKLVQRGTHDSHLVSIAMA